MTPDWWRGQDVRIAPQYYSWVRHSSMLSRTYCVPLVDWPREAWDKECHLIWQDEPTVSRGLPTHRIAFSTSYFGLFYGK